MPKFPCEKIRGLRSAAGRHVGFGRARLLPRLMSIRRMGGARIVSQRFACGFYRTRAALFVCAPERTPLRQPAPGRRA